MLTIQELKNAKAGDKPRKLYDRDGLYHFLTPTGGKLWHGKCRANGREKTLSLGPYPNVGMAEAREKWQDAPSSTTPPPRSRPPVRRRRPFFPSPRSATPGWTKKHASQV